MLLAFGFDIVCFNFFRLVVDSFVYQLANSLFVIDSFVNQLTDSLVVGDKGFDFQLVRLFSKSYFTWDLGNGDAILSLEPDFNFAPISTGQKVTLTPTYGVALKIKF